MIYIPPLEGLIKHFISYIVLRSTDSDATPLGLCAARRGRCQEWPDISVGVFRVALRKKNRHAGQHSSSLA